MSIAAIIPARSGSKRLPGKNLKILMGKPLITWTIEAAIDSGVFSEVIVSTDSPEIAEIAQQSGASTPFTRPQTFSSDEASSASVVRHALSYLGSNPNSCALLQPTSPLRGTDDIFNAVNQFRSHDAKSLVSVYEMHEKKNWLFENNSDGKLHRIASVNEDKPLYALNGAIYVFQIDWFLKSGKFLDEDTSFFIMSKMNSIDIDTLNEFELAEMYMKLKLQQEVSS